MYQKGLLGAVLELIGIAFLEDIFSALERAKMMLKAFIIILWIDISHPSLQDGSDFVVNFLKMRNPFNWTYSKEDVGKNREDNEGGIQRRHVLGEDESKEKTSVQEPQGSPLRRSVQSQG